MRDLPVVQQRLLESFQKAAKERNKRESSGPKGWIVYERQKMHEAVTKERAMLGKGPVPIADVERVENLALGHSDYASKWSLYCAELVLN